MKMFFKQNNVKFCAQETHGGKIPTDMQLEMLRSSVVSGKSNSDYNIFIHYC